MQVVIVTARGSWPLLDACLRSLAAHPPHGVEVRIDVVDNASEDGTVEAIHRGHPGVAVTELARNHGFAFACNRAMALGGDPDYVLLLNPDTEVHPGALDALIGVLERHPRTAVVGPRLLGPDGHADHNAKRRFPTPGAALAHFLRLGGLGYGRPDIPGDGSGVVDAVSGSCLLVRGTAIGDVGRLDEGYWMYGEDLDWCRRFAEHGWQTRYEGAATVLHVKHGVTGRHRALRTNWAFHRSMGRFYRRWSAGRRPLLDTAVYAGILLRFAASAASSAAARALGPGGRRTRD